MRHLRYSISQSDSVVNVEVHALRKGESAVFVEAAETQRLELAAPSPPSGPCDCTDRP